jgi:hypothetical protein
MELCLAVWHCGKLHQKYRLQARRKKAFPHGENNDNWEKKFSLLPTDTVCQSFTQVNNESTNIFYGIRIPWPSCQRARMKKEFQKCKRKWENVRQAFCSVVSFLVSCSLRLIIYWFVNMGFTSFNQVLSLV